MKKTLYTLFAIACVTAPLTSEASNIVWTGATNNNLDTNTNWEGNVLPTTGDTIIFNQSAEVNNQVVLPKLGHVNILVNSGVVKVKLTNDETNYDGTLTIAEGATLENLGSATRLHASSYNIYGTYLQTWDIRLTQKTTFNLGTTGIIKSNSKFYDTNNTMSFTAQVSTVNTAITDGSYSLISRNLMEIAGGFNGNNWNGYNWNNNNIITGSLGETLIFDSTMGSLTSESNNLADFEGKYHLGTSGNNLVLTYVQKNIPEPSTSMLGIIGIGGVLLRRKRS